MRMGLSAAMPPGALHKKVVKLYDAGKYWGALSLVPTIPCASRDQDQNLTKVFASPLRTSPELLMRWLRLF